MSKYNITFLIFATKKYIYPLFFVRTTEVSVLPPALPKTFVCTLAKLPRYDNISLKATYSALISVVSTSIFTLCYAFTVFYSVIVLLLGPDLASG